MQTLVPTNSTLQPTHYISSPSRSDSPSKPVVTASTPSLNRPVLNQPDSAKYQPPSATTPSYNPEQPQAVERSRTDQQLVDRQNAADVQTQQQQQTVHMADERMASSVLTGEYNSSGNQNGATPRVGGYLTINA